MQGLVIVDDKIPVMNKSRRLVSVVEAEQADSHVVSKHFGADRQCFFAERFLS